MYEAVREKLESMKELCKERHSFYEKQNDLKDRKKKLRNCWNDKKCGGCRFNE